jgi:hypothetical protein
MPKTSPSRCIFHENVSRETFFSSGERNTNIGFQNCSNHFRGVKDTEDFDGIAADAVLNEVR